MLLPKLYVKVVVPALSEEYEFSVPDTMAVFDAQKLMVRILNSEYGVSDSVANLILVDATDMKALRSECNFRQLGIEDGAKLLLL